MFSKYIEPFNNIDYNNINYYIEDNYERHGINDFLMLKRILKDNDVRRAHINVTISKPRISNLEISHARKNSYIMEKTNNLEEQSYQRVK